MPNFTRLFLYAIAEATSQVIAPSKFKYYFQIKSNLIINSGKILLSDKAIGLFNTSFSWTILIIKETWLERPPYPISLFISQTIKNILAINWLFPVSLVIVVKTGKSHII